MDIINLYENYNKYFSSDLKDIFKLISNVAQKSSCRIYLIGGIVRDLLLNIDSRDIDVTVEGDIDCFSKNLKECKNVKILSLHRSFGGLKAQINSEKVDFTSTRSETYPQKGHLPVLKEIGCSLKDDVIRRDFTVNSLALSLNEDDFANLVDFVGGYDDLKNKKLRILHEKSFIDDPTRIIRGLKYSVRLGFELDEYTKKLQDEYLRNINYDMGYNRIRNELRLTFNLNLQCALEKFISQGIYKLISKKTSPQVNLNFEEVIKKYSPEHVWLIYFGLFAINEDDEFLTKFELTKPERNIIEGAKRLVDVEVSDDDFEIYKAFCAYKTESLILAANFNHQEKIFRYLDKLKNIKITVSGEDIINLGFAPSEKFKSARDYVLQRKIYNPALTHEQELSLLNQYFSGVL